MSYFSNVGMRPDRILLPGDKTQLVKWSVIACDQYTSQPDYWSSVEDTVSQAPSALRIVYPECYAGRKPADTFAIHSYMQKYKSDVLTDGFTGFSLVERETTTGKRIGLVASFDLECYDYTPGAKTLIRATEGTVEERLPPRMDIRRGACLECPHVMLLINDKEKSVIESLYNEIGRLRSIYDFELMKNGGHIRGWAVEDEKHINAVMKALSALRDKNDGFLFAVGDGNHSFAAARACWREVKKGLSAEEVQNHPMRFAMAEIVNLYDDSLVFEPIHRAVYGVGSGELTLDFIMYCRERGMSVVPCDTSNAHLYMLDNPLRFENVLNPLAVGIVQEFLDKWLKANPHASVDYIHGLDNLNSLSAARVRLTAIDKGGLFDYVTRNGVLPRKAFSMGEADDKRFYLECRAIM